MTMDEEQKGMLNEVVAKYCDWLNQLEFHEVDSTPYTADMFLVTHEEDQDHWGSGYGVNDHDVLVLDAVLFGGSIVEQRMMVWSIYDGDEGGGSRLTTWWSREQEFEVVDGKVINGAWLPWQLDDAVQEFDTMRQMWIQQGKIVEVGK